MNLKIERSRMLNSFIRGDQETTAAQNEEPCIAQSDERSADLANDKEPMQNAEN